MRHRVAPPFTRVPSQRYSRRSRSEESQQPRQPRPGTLERGGGGQVTRHLSQPSLYQTQPPGSHMSRAGSLPRVSLAMQSLPPEQVDSSLVEGDLSMRSLQYLESRGLFGSRTQGGHQSRSAEPSCTLSGSLFCYMNETFYENKI